MLESRSQKGRRAPEADGIGESKFPDAEIWLYVSGRSVQEQPTNGSG